MNEHPGAGGPDRRKWYALAVVIVVGLFNYIDRLSMSSNTSATEASNCQAPAGISAMSRKYGYNESDVAASNQRQIAMLNLLTSTLEAQRAKGRECFVGKALSAVDFYWAAFSVIMDILPDALCPVAAGPRAMFENIDASVKAAISPILLEHRDRILGAHFKLPMEF